ncbi:hypothetical protein Hdeb2414_s0022g00614381 [Helianthus debilis subsp. tardiflorus]
MMTSETPFFPHIIISLFCLNLQESTSATCTNGKAVFRQPREPQAAAAGDARWPETPKRRPPKSDARRQGKQRRQGTRSFKKVPTTNPSVVVVFWPDDEDGVDGDAHGADGSGSGLRSAGAVSSKFDFTSVLV